ncbi:MAG: hypothetical protein KDD68_15660, partial [Bdellovibrionales bacterium]|nr:hypothetical protein [Bdellovibrionales bacterium]
MRRLGPVTTVLLLTLLSCQPAGGPKVHSGQGAQGENPTPPPGDRPPEGDIGGDPAWRICSNLNFDSVTWPAELSARQIEDMALALSITGSFEGRSGWHNISTNFDGQGMSLGLLQQNFGQGSLQPLLIRMRDHHSGVWRGHFAPGDLNSMEAMLAAWESSSVVGAKSVSESLWDREISVLDLPSC